MMQVKDNVRRRRQARIRELTSDLRIEHVLESVPQEERFVPTLMPSNTINMSNPSNFSMTTPEVPAAVKSASLAPYSSPATTNVALQVTGIASAAHVTNSPLHTMEAKPLEVEPHASNDPEVVWKEKQRQWQRQLAAESYGSRGGGRVGDGGSHEGTEPSNGSWLHSLRNKLMLSIIVFAAVWGIYQVDSTITLKARAWIAQALTEDMDFNAVAVWYEQTFQGAPSFIPIFNHQPESATKVNSSTVLYSPVKGTIVAPFTKELKGIRIAPTAEKGASTVVKAFEAGQVKQVSIGSGGVTIVIQHANNTSSVYSGLQAADVKVNDWVQGGERIGVLTAAPQTQTEAESSPELYFSIQHEDTYMDPTELISFD